MQVQFVSTQRLVPAGLADAPPPAPTITAYDALVDSLLVELAAVFAKVPQLDMAHPDTVDFVNSHQNVPIEGLRTGVQVVEQHSDLAAAVGDRLDVAQSKDDLQYIEAFRRLQSATLEFGGAVQFTCDSKQARLTTGVQQTKAILIGMARGARYPHLATALKNLRLATARRKRQSKVQPSQTAALVVPQKEVNH